MAKYRKKPVVIEAHRLGDDGWPDSIWQGVIDCKIILYMNDYNITGKGYASISTLEGKMHVGIGDYIIKGVQGEFYPCKPNIFEQTYEAIETGDTKINNFKQELKALLKKYSACILIEMDDCSDLHGVSGEKVVVEFNIPTEHNRFETETAFLCEGWGFDYTDI